MDLTITLIMIIQVKQTWSIGGSFFEDTKCLVVSRYKFKKSKKFKKLLLICNKFERIFKNDRLDIEFCIKKIKLLFFNVGHLVRKER